VVTLLLSYRWEHALIGAVINRSNQNYPDGKLGRTAIQKLLYFLNVLGVPMRYNFDIHHYGPFCPTIMHDVEWLAADDVVEDCSDDSRYSNYKPGSGWSQLAIQFNDRLTEYDEQIESVCKAFSDMRPETLELIATLDFSYRWVRATGGNGPWRDRAVSKFKAIKKDKFPEEEIERWYDVLVKVGLIEA
jgi:uncharacterized protein YwgA